MLKLPEPLYWDLTPREIHVISTQFLEFQDVDQIRFGTVAAAAWNAMRGGKKPKSWKNWKDFFIPFSKKRPRGMSHAEMLSQARKMIRETYPWKDN